MFSVDLEMPNYPGPLAYMHAPPMSATLTAAPGMTCVGQAQLITYSFSTIHQRPCGRHCVISAPLSPPSAQCPLWGSISRDKVSPKNTRIQEYLSSILGLSVSPLLAGRPRRGCKPEPRGEDAAP
jgi:hypothetical protein